MVLAAQKEELDWLKKAEVYEKRTLEECWKETGKAPITLKWINRNKGDAEKPNYRSRIVVREVKKQHGALPGHMLFSNMPPLEAAKILCSDLATRKTSKKGRTLVLALYDISRAHFYGRAQRKVYVTLPPGDEQEGYCAILLKTMYGTQDASHVCIIYIFCQPATGTGNRQPAPATGIWQPATGNRQPATGTDSRHPAPATGNRHRQPASGSRQLATGNRQPAPTAGNRQPAAGSRQPAAGNRQPAPAAGNRQPATGNRHRQPATGTGSRQPATGNCLAPSNRQPPPATATRKWQQHLQSAPATGAC